MCLLRALGPAFTLSVPWLSNFQILWAQPRRAGGGWNEIRHVKVCTVRPPEQAAVWVQHAATAPQHAVPLHFCHPLTRQRSAGARSQPTCTAGPISELVSSDPDLTCERTMEEGEDTVKPLLRGQWREGHKPEIVQGQGNQI